MSFWVDKRVVVTGGAGFIGRHVVRALERQRCRSVFVVRSRDYDLMAEQQVVRLFEDTRPDVVVHLAGLVGSIVSNTQRPAEFFYRNLVMGTYVLHYAWIFGVRKCVATMSGAGYPADAPVPFDETSLWDGLPQPETAPYSLSKRLLHIQADAYFRQYGFVCVVVIPGNAYGPFDNFDMTDGRVVAALARKFVDAADSGARTLTLWGTGRATRDFIYGEDLARGILLAGEKYERAELLNISSGQETSIKRVAEVLNEETGFSGEIIWDATRPDGQLRRWFDISKARADLGFEPQVEIEEGLHRTVAWFKQHKAALKLG
jgi:GDP-L-fucose synthase